ncbi:transposase [Sinorhizobium meliloti]|nr:transposase [Sinorhizobium meliloti]
MRLTTRQAKSVPVLDTLKRHLDATLARIGGKSEFAKAIRYITSRWQAFTVYATDGRLEMSHNAAERAIRPLVLGRKNYLFSGSDAGGERAAVIYTIVETCKWAASTRTPISPTSSIASPIIPQIGSTNSFLGTGPPNHSVHLNPQWTLSGSRPNASAR